MKTASFLTGRTSAIVRFSCGVATMAALTFSVLSAQAVQPQKGVRIGVEGLKRYACSDDCAGRLNQCLSAGTKSSICYYNYNMCVGGCTSGAARPTQSPETELQ